MTPLESPDVWIKSLEDRGYIFQLEEKEMFTICILRDSKGIVLASGISFTSKDAAISDCRNKFALRNLLNWIVALQTRAQQSANREAVKMILQIPRK